MRKYAIIAMSAVALLSLGCETTSSAMDDGQLPSTADGADDTVLIKIGDAISAVVTHQLRTRPRTSRRQGCSRRYRSGRLSM